MYVYLKYSHEKKFVMNLSILYCLQTNFSSIRRFDRIIKYERDKSNRSRLIDQNSLYLGIISNLNDIITFIRKVFQNVENLFFNACMLL